MCKDGRTLRYASYDLRADPAVVLDAVQRDPLALEHARGAALVLRADRTVVLAAVRKDGAALRYASDDLRAEPAVVLRCACSRTYEGLVTGVRDFGSVSCGAHARLFLRR